MTKIFLEVAEFLFLTVALLPISLFVVFAMILAVDVVKSILAQ